MSIDRFIAIAAGAVGLGERDPAFRALCGPGETEQRQRELAGLSTCALFLRGCLAWTLYTQEMPAGAPWIVWADPAGRSREPQVPPRLWALYVDQMAMADLVAVCDTIRPGSSAQSVRSAIRPGSLVIVGNDPRIHAYLVESVERDGWPDGSIEVTTIEAGQIDGAGRQRVERKRHEIDASGIDRITLEQDHASGTWVPSSVGPCPRPVAYVLDASKLLEGT